MKQQQKETFAQPKKRPEGAPPTAAELQEEMARLTRERRHLLAYLKAIQEKRGKASPPPENRLARYGHPLGHHDVKAMDRTGNVGRLPGGVFACATLRPREYRPLKGTDVRFRN